MAPLRTLAPVVALGMLALPALSACSTASSGSASASAPSVTVTGTPAVPSVDAARLAVIGTCLKNAGLPTPTSTDAAAGAAEIVRLLQDPKTASALRACGIPLPGATLSGTSSTT